MNALADVVYANFANLVYLRNWDSVKRGSEISETIWDDWAKDPANLSSKSRFCYMAFSEDENNEAPLWDSHFRGWTYLYSGNDTIIYKDLFGLDLNTKSNGFYAAAFVRGEDVVVSFRGTNDFMDMMTDMELALFDRYSSQLTSVYWFIRHCKILLGEGNWKFYFTGHSLGGALAQFAHIINGQNNKGITWNALGAGLYLKTHFDTHGRLVNTIINDICANIGVNYDAVDVNSIYNIWKKYELNNDEKPVYDDILQIFLTSSGRRNGFYKFKSVDGKYLRLSFGFKQQGKEAAAAGMEPRNFMLYKRAAMEITGMFKTLMSYNKGMAQYGRITDIPICNYYIPNDWTTCLQTRLGYVYDATSKDSNHEVKASDLVDDNAKRVLVATIKNYGFEKHHISNFLMFMDDKGMIQGGKMRKSFIDNVVRDFFSVKFATDKKTKALVTPTSYSNIFNTDTNTIMDKLLESMSKWLETSKYYVHGQVYKESITNYKPLKVGNSIILGSWNNILFDKVEGSAPRVELIGRGGKK